MIRITINDRELAMSGHAGYAPRGQDIVCAAVSSLYETLCAANNKLLNNELNIAEWPLSVVIRWPKEASIQAKALISAFFIGINGIAESYPEYVHIDGDITPKP